MDYHDILSYGPYDLAAEEKDQLYRELLSELTDSHRSRCLPYDKMCRILRDIPATRRQVERIPMVPVSAFKQTELLSINRSEIFKVITSSGTTGQRPSKLFLDQQTAAWQQQTLQRIVSSFIGNKRLPMLIIDSPAVLKDRNLFSARGAGILGFSMFGTKRVYALNEDMSLNEAALRKLLDESGREPILVFGFTYLIWRYFYQALKKAGCVLPLSNGILIHGGGWKKLQHEAVSAHAFSEGLREICGIRRIHNYYGMAEQTGCIYMECEYGHLHVSSYSDVLIRNMEDFSCCKNGTEGVIQVLSPMTASYPGHSLLTEDKGMLLGEDTCPCGRLGKIFLITGRIPAAEIRGCSDTYEE